MSSKTSVIRDERRTRLWSKTTPPRRRGALPGLSLILALIAVVGAVALLVEGRRPTGPREVVFPLPERFSGSYTDDWGAARVQGAHEGTDVFAPEGTPIRSITDGTVGRSFGSGDSGWNTLGGYTVTVEAAYDAGSISRGDVFYYAHMNASTPLEPGETVEAGQKIGEVGDTGQGPEGTRGLFPPHLHLGWYDGSLFGGDRAEADSGAMNPYPLLRRIERGIAARPRPG